MPIIHKLEKVIQLPTLKRTAAYCRVSSGKDAMLHSLSAQISYYSEYIQKHNGWIYSGTFADEAYSGTKDERPQFQRMLEECRAGKIDLVLTKSISRFARNTVTLLATVRELKALGIEVIFERENISSMSGDGELMLSILSGFAQEESLSVSENIKWRIKDKFKAGIATYQKILGYKFDDGSFKIVPEEAPIVRMIYDDYLSGMGKEAISQKVTSMGYKIGPNAVMNMLQSEKYIGNMMLQKTFSSDHLKKEKMINHGELPKYLFEESHEPIIDLETYQKVQAEISNRRKKHSPPNKPREHYAFTGMIKCGMCSASFHRKIAGSEAKYKKVAWVCFTSDRKGKDACPAQMLPEDILKQKICESLSLEEFDEVIFKDRVREIQVTAHYQFNIILKDGTAQTISWQYKSRRDSWSERIK